MAHPYTTEERVRRFCAGRSDRLVALLDQNLDGIPDTDGIVSVFNDAINRAANRIDSALARTYAVPFASATPSSPHYAPTYPQVADLCDVFALARLLSRNDPNDVEAAALFKEFFDLIEEYRTGASTIVGASAADAEDAAQPFAWEGKGTTVAGMVDQNGDPSAAYTDDSVDQTRGM